jgi:hypothetical protein
VRFALLGIVLLVSSACGGDGNPDGPDADLDVDLDGDSDGCAPGEVRCGDRCAQVDRDEANCGACGVACEAGAPCIQGACDGGGDADADTDTDTGTGTDCGELTWCNGGCIDTGMDEENCGDCGVACGPDRYCEAGVCLCTLGEDCAGFCADTMNDPYNCGVCNFDCRPGEICDAGACRCAPGTIDCGDECADLDRDVRNCGSCDNASAVCYYCDTGTCLQDCGFGCGC